MIGVSEDELRKERKKIEKFIKDNPYPKYNDVIEIIKEDKDFLDMFAEYGTPNHQWMKEIYENIFDKEIVKRNGEMINDRGNLYTMQMNFYTLLDILRNFFKKSDLDDDDERLIWYNMKDLLSNYWHNVGDWKH